MMRRTLSGVLVAMMALAFVVGSSTKADAAFIAYICNDVNCDGVGDTIVVDNGAGDTLNLTAGIIQTSAVLVGGLTVVTTTDQSKPLIGSPTSPNLDINYAATGIGEVWLYASDTDFFGTHTFSLINSGNFSGTGSVSSTLYGGLVNFATLSPTICTTGTQTSSPFTGTCSGAGGSAGPYALLLNVHIIRTTAGTTTGDALVTVPEPASMAVFGLGMLGAGIVARRRRQRR